MYSIRLPSAFSRAWVPSVVCQYFRHTTGRIKVYQAADLSTFLLRPVCFRPTSCTSAMMELMPCALTPACGVASICRFVQAATALSIILSSFARLHRLSWVSRYCLRILFSRSFPSILLLQYVLLSPSSLSGPSPCVLPAGAYWLFAEGEGFEPPCHF